MEIVFIKSALNVILYVLFLIFKVPSGQGDT